MVHVTEMAENAWVTRWEAKYPISGESMCLGKTPSIIPSLER